MAKIITIQFANMDKCALVEAVLSGMGIQYGIKEVELPKSSEKKLIEEAQKSAQEEANKSNCSVQISVPTDNGYVEVTAEPKKAEKETGKKPAPKKDTKSSDGFDVELYHEVARELGVMGVKGKVYHFARQTVYDGMSEVKKSKRGKMTAKVRKALLAQLLTEAQRLGIQWYIDKVAEDKVAKAQ